MPLRPPLSRWFPSTCSFQAALLPLTIPYIHTAHPASPGTEISWSVSHSSNIFMLKQCRKDRRGEGRENCSVSSPHMFCESHFRAHSFLKLKAPTLANQGLAGLVILMMLNMPVTNAGKRSETAQPRACSCGPHLAPPQHLSCTPPILCSLLLKFCV